MKGKISFDDYNIHAKKLLDDTLQFSDLVDDDDLKSA
ncbi:MAG: hypothetical protein RL329_1694 [Bacteroidota bacterium]